MCHPPLPHGRAAAALLREMLPGEAAPHEGSLKSPLQLSPPEIQSQADKSRLEVVSAAAAVAAGGGCMMLGAPCTQVGSDPPALAGHRHLPYPFLTAPAVVLNTPS